MDILKYNSEAWDRQVAESNCWTVPVSSEVIDRARQGDWSIVLTPTIPVPRSWFPEKMGGLEVLCLASGGGQQGPILAATGARVTVYDASPAQLGRDREVAERDGLELTTMEGDMADLGRIPSGSIDLIFHPCSNCYARSILPVWKECARVLRPGGALLAGFSNPLRYLFPEEHYENGDLSVQNRIPWDDARDLPPEELKRMMEKGETLQFAHSLEDQIGGQLAAGLAMTAFFEDRYAPDAKDPISEFIATFIATRAVKMG